MKTVFAFATLVALSAGSAFAAEGQIADQTLSKMGLGGMKVMSDEQGMQVRGMAMVSVSGYSTAWNKNAETFNQYSASGHEKAKGSSYSIVFSKSGRHLTAAGAFGGAKASAD